MTYTETQKFTQAWLWILLIVSGMIPIGVFATGFYLQVLRGQQFGNHPMGNIGLIIVSVLVVLLFLGIFLLFGFAKLTTMIDNKGISYRYFPFHIRFHTIPWDEIERFEVVKYSPIMEYGGWGVRFGYNGKAFNVSGNMGLKLRLKNGRDLLIGTGRPEEMRAFLLNFRH